MSTLTVKCPTCTKPVEWVSQNLFRPFCSERCKLIDLGEWANETRILEGGPLTEQDLESMEEEIMQAAQRAHLHQE